jgi:hypothetical protein
MADFITCNYEETLVAQLERLSRDFTSIPSDDTSIDLVLLNQNTELLNTELKNYRRLQNELIKGKQITSVTKRKFREQFVPKPIAGEFIQAPINTVGDLTRYILANSDDFRRSNLTSDNQILDALRVLDPISYRTFAVEYPSIDLRLRSSPTISSTEVSALIRENGIDPKIFGSKIQQNRQDVFNLFEQFLSKLGIGIGIMGSFCALVENVFALAKGQRDISGNPAEFLGNFQNVLGLINPKAGEVIGKVQGLVQTLQNIQTGTLDIANNMQGAIGLLASAFGISINFVDILDKILGKTKESGSIEVQWNLSNIRDALANDPRFLVVISQTNKPLGDITQNETVTNDDTIALQTYIDGTASDDVTNYIETVFLPYLNQTASTFSDFADFPSAGEPDSSLGDLIEGFSSIASSFGSAAGSGDFGIAKLVESISLVSGITSSIQGLISGSKPINIKNLFQQLDQVLELAEGARKGMFADFNKFAADYKGQAENALKEAEKNAVPNPEKTAEINGKNQESLEDKFTQALEKVAEASKRLGSVVTEDVNKIKYGIRELAAVGVLDQTADQLLSVIDQSAGQLKSKIKMFSPTSLDNGFHFNMGSSYAKMAGQIASAQNAASDDVTETMKDSVKGMIAQSSDKFQTKSKEEVEFVALRFCKLAGEIERLYNDITKPLEATVSNFQGADRSLSAVGNDTTLKAVSAGAIRYDTQTRLAAMQRAGTIDATIAAPYINGAGQRSTIPDQGTQSAGLLPPLPVDYEFPTIEELLMPGNPLASTLRISAKGPSRNIGYDPGPASRKSGIWGFTARGPGSDSNGVDPDAFRKLFNLAKNWRKPVIVNSAFRSPEANAAAGKGASPNSNHLRGTAFDCSTRGYSMQDKLDFCNIAYNVGLTGIITYGSFIHISTSPREGGSSNGPFSYKSNESLAGPLGNRSFRR